MSDDPIPLPPKAQYPEHMEKAPAGLFEHYCMHPDCKSWGAFGFEKRYGQGGADMPWGAEVGPRAGGRPALKSCVRLP
jgi:hypothetical protein